MLFTAASLWDNLFQVLLLSSYFPGAVVLHIPENRLQSNAIIPQTVHHELREFLNRK